MLYMYVKFSIKNLSFLYNNIFIDNLHMQE